MALLVVGATLLLGLAALLRAPVCVRLDLDTGADSRRLRWQVRWLRLTWCSDRSRRTARGRRDGRTRVAKPRRRRRGAGVPPRLRAALSTPGLLRRAGRLLRQLLVVLRPAEFEASVRLGLDDPASTGVVAGAALAITAAWPCSYRLRVQPEFDEPVLAARAHAAWSIAPGTLLWPVVSFLAAPVVWRAGWAAWKAPSTGTYN
ncbi:MAG: DUF2953 domain-containing protein [Acidobacteriota bacterium]|nr:DUF2953 domain-containing protein [Acidobacteriota bacterium]